MPLALKKLLPVILLVGAFYLWYGVPLVVLGASDDRLVEAITPDETYDVRLVHNAIELGSLDYPFRSLGHLHLNLATVPLMVLHRFAPVSDRLILITLRTIPLFFAAATSLLVFVFARRFFGEHSAWFATLIVMTQPRILGFSTISHPDMEQMFFVTLTLYLVARLAEDGRARWLFGSAAAAGLAFSAKYSGVLLLPLIVAVVLFKARWKGQPAPPGSREHSNPRMLLACAAVGLATLLFSRLEFSSPQPQPQAALADFFLDEDGNVLGNVSYGKRIPRIENNTFEEIFAPSQHDSIQALIAKARRLEQTGVTFRPESTSSLWAVPVIVTVQMLDFPAGLWARVYATTPTEALANFEVDGDGRVTAYRSNGVAFRDVTGDPLARLLAVTGTDSMSNAMEEARTLGGEALDYTPGHWSTFWAVPIRVRLRMDESPPKLHAEVFAVGSVPYSVPNGRSGDSGDRLATAKARAMTLLRVATMGFGLWALALALAARLGRFAEGRRDVVDGLMETTYKIFIMSAVFGVALAISSPYIAYNWNFLDGALGVAAYLGHGGQLTQNVGIGAWFAILTNTLGTPVAMILVTVSFAAMVRGLLKRNFSPTLFTTMILWGWVLVFLATVFGRINTRMSHYLFPAFPPLLILVGAVLGQTFDRITRSSVAGKRTRHLALGVTGVVLLVAFTPWRLNASRQHWLAKYYTSKTVEAGRWVVSHYPASSAVLYGNGTYVPPGFENAVRVLNPTLQTLTIASFDLVLVQACDLQIGLDSSRAGDFAGGEARFTPAYRFYNGLLTGDLGYRLVGAFNEILVYGKSPATNPFPTSTGAESSEPRPIDDVQERCWNTPKHF